MTALEPIAPRTEVVTRYKVPFDMETVDIYEELLAEALSLYEDADGIAPSGLPNKANEEWVLEVAGKQRRKLAASVDEHGRDSQFALLAARMMYETTLRAINELAGFPTELIRAMATNKPIPPGLYELVLSFPTHARPAVVFSCPGPGCFRKTPDPRISRYCQAHRQDYEVMSPEESIEWARLANQVELQLAAASAVSTTTELYNDEAQPGSVRLAAATSILDRSGYGKSQEYEVTVRTEASAFDFLTQRLDALGLAMKPASDMQIVDAEVVEDESD